MPQADNIVSVPSDAGTTDFFSENIGGVSRRSAITLGGAAVLAVAVPTVAQLAVKATPARDERFWAAWREYKAVEAGWAADPAKDDATYDGWGEKLHKAQVAMLMVPVTSARAVLAKYASTEGQDINLPAPVHSSLAVIGWDIERLTKLEMWG